MNGQRLVQPVSDIFLGWTEGRSGRQGYVRQLRDIKTRFAVETFGRAEMLHDAGWSGHTLALSYARSGDPALISGYLGNGDVFDKAIEAFSVAYADQNDEDYAALKRAISSGKHSSKNRNRPPAPARNSVVPRATRCPIPAVHHRQQPASW